VREDEEEEGNPDEYVDVLDILDGKAQPDDGSDSPTVRTKQYKNTQQEVESDGEEGTDDDSGEQLLDQELSPDEEEDPTALENLDAFVSNLEVTSKRKTLEDEYSEPQSNPRGKKRKLMKEHTEAGLESVFAAGKSFGMPTSLFHCIDDVCVYVICRSDQIKLGRPSCSFEESIVEPYFLQKINQGSCII
jgi:U3 small nucleolar RNA-associated protein 14